MYEASEPEKKQHSKKGEGMQVLEERRVKSLPSKWVESNTIILDAHKHVLASIFLSTKITIINNH